MKHYPDQDVADTRRLRPQAQPVFPEFNDFAKHRFSGVGFGVVNEYVSDFP